MAVKRFFPVILWEMKYCHLPLSVFVVVVVVVVVLLQVILRKYVNIVRGRLRNISNDDVQMTSSSVPNIEKIATLVTDMTPVPINNFPIQFGSH